MAFALSKLLWLLVKPSHLLLLLLIVGGCLLCARRLRAGRAFIVLATLLAVAIAAFPIADWAALPLERRFPLPSTMPPEVDGIVVLGGALSNTGGEVGLNGAAERVTGLVALARRYPEAQIVYTGGSSLIGGEDTREADLARRLLTTLGVDTEGILFERESRNTRENAVLSRRLARPGPDETWLLVTSAMHMPRSVGSFRAAVWPVIPYPVDFQADLDRPLQYQIDFSGNLALLDSAAKEWVGLAAYYWLGYTDALLPAPDG